MQGRSRDVVLDRSVVQDGGRSGALYSSLIINNSYGFREAQELLNSATRLK